MEGKRSLFAQHMQLKKKQVSVLGPVLSSVREKSSAELASLQSPPENTPAPSFPVIFSLPEPSLSLPSHPISQLSSVDPAIHNENLEKISKMSAEELKSSLQEIETMIDPSTIQFLKKRGQKRMNPVENPKETPCKDMTENEIFKLSSESNKTCLHYNDTTLEFDRIRYDSCGEIVQRFEKNQWLGECQGFTLREICGMARSTVPAQRIIAIQSLIYAISTDFDKKIEFLYEECQIDRLLLFELTDKNLNVKAKSLLLVQKIFTENLSTNLKVQHKFEFLYPMVESSRNSILAKEIREKSGILEEEESRDVTKCCGSKGFDLIGNLICDDFLSYLVQFAYEEINDVLLCFSLHSVTCCYQIVRHEIFHKIIEGVPGSYEVLTVLAKSSLPAAHKIHQNLQDRYFSDLLTYKSSQELCYVLFCQNQVTPIRAIAFELASQGSAEIFLALSRLITPSNFYEYTGILELAAYKYIQNFSEYIENCWLLYGILMFISSWISSSATLPVNKTEMIKSILGIIKKSEIVIDLRFTEKEEEKYLKRLDQYFEVDQLEGELIPKIRLIDSAVRILAYELEKNKDMDLEGAEENIKKIYENCDRLLKHVLERQATSNSVPKLICYRLQPIIHLMISIVNLINPLNTSSLYRLVLFLHNYDELLFLNILMKITDQIPEFYKGYVFSDKNLNNSVNFLQRSSKVSCYFLGLNENPYFPLKFDWAFVPLTTESPKNLKEYFAFLQKFLESSALIHGFSQIIMSVNLFFIRKDADYLDFSESLSIITEKIALSANFTREVNKVKSSVLNTVRDFISCSYLERTYLRWVISFMQDGVDSDIFHDILEEFNLLIGRIKLAIGQDLIGGCGKYTKFLAANS